MTKLERRGQPPRRGIPTYYDGYTDRRQAGGVVAFYCRVYGGELVRSRVDYLQLALVMRAKLQAQLEAQLEATGEPIPAAALTTWRNDPVAFAERILGVEITPWQRELLRSPMPFLRRALRSGAPHHRLIP